MDTNNGKVKPLSYVLILMIIGSCFPRHSSK